VPKRMKGMFKRGASFYVRQRENYRDCWVSLGSDYNEACRRLREFRRGRAPVKSKRVEDAVEGWLQGYVPTARNAKGVRLARQRASTYFVPFFKFRSLGSVRAEDLRRYRLHLERQPLSPQSVVHLLSDARCFLNWCEAEGLVERSPFPRKLLPRLQERPPDRLTDEEVEKLVRLPDPYGFVVRFGLGTGLRWGELVRAMSTDVKVDMLTVHRTKSGKLRRVPVPRALREELRLRIGQLIPFRHGDGFAKQVRKLSGVERFHPHQMRHTFACRWLERGGNLSALQRAPRALLDRNYGTLRAAHG
jgi:integrase/recombinase XerD